MKRIVRQSAPLPPASTESVEAQAATKIQTTWRQQRAARAEATRVAEETRRDLVIFAIDNPASSKPASLDRRLVAGSRSKILQCDRSEKITAKLLGNVSPRGSEAAGAGASWLRRRPDLGLKNLSPDATALLLDFLEGKPIDCFHGKDLCIGPQLARELRSAAIRYRIPELRDEMSFILQLHQPDEGLRAVAGEIVGRAGLAAMHLKDVVTTFKLMKDDGYRSRSVDIKREGTTESVGEVRLVEADGSGDLPPMVFLHGLTSAGIRSTGILEAFRSDCQRVIALDLPGHGSSDVPSDGLSADTLERGVLQTIDTLVKELGPVNLIGNSLGGWLAALYSLARPENVLSRVFISPGGTPMPLYERERMHARFRPSNVAQARGALAGVPFKGIQAMIAPFVAKVMTGESDFVALMESGRSGKKSLRGYQIRALGKVMVVFGKKDTVLLPSHRRHWKNNVAEGSVFIEPEEMGHCPGLEDPVALRDAIVPFLRKCHAERRSARPDGAPASQEMTRRG